MISARRPNIVQQLGQWINSRIWPLSNSAFFIMLIVLGIMLFFTVAPVVITFIRSFDMGRPGDPFVFSWQNWTNVFSDPSILGALGNTFFLATVRTFLSLAVAIFFAWVVTRTDTPFRGAIEFSMWLAFFFPKVSLASAWALLAAPDYGLINVWINSLPFGNLIPDLNIFSMGGLIWVLVATTGGLKFMLLTPAFRQMDASLEESAFTSGSSPLATLRRITLPLLTPAVMVVIIMGFIFAMDSFEVELLIGAPANIWVYSTKIWYLVYQHQPPAFGEATALGIVFFVVLIIMVFIYNRVLSRRQYTTVTGRSFSTRVTRLGRTRYIVFAICLIWIIVTLVLPISALVIMSFMKLPGFFNIAEPFTLDNWIRVLGDRVLLSSLKNTLLLGLGTAIIGVIVYSIIGYLMARYRRMGSIVGVLVWLPNALPGVLVGIALLWFYLGFGGGLTFLYGTVIGLIVAMVIQRMPVGAQMARTGVMQISQELELASIVSGASWWTTMRRVLLPLLSPTLLAVGLACFAMAAREVSSVMFLASVDTRPLSLLIVDYNFSARQGAASVANLILVLVVLGAAAAQRLISRKITFRAS
jgi:iron(III) transport system permease protein